MIKKGINRNNFFQVPVPYGSMLNIPPTNSHLLAAKQEQYQKAHLLMENTEECFGEKSQVNGPVERKR